MNILSKPLVYLIVSLCLSIDAKSQFDIRTNPNTGAITQISNPLDQHKMNWIFAAGDQFLVWQKAEQDWGLGRYTITGLGLTNEKWTTPVQQETIGKNSIVTYKTAALDIRAERELVGKDFIETYTFRNTSDKSIKVDKLDIFTPFNDNYPDAKIAATSRCNAHIWAGLNSSYVNAIRMNGEGSHLGMVLTKGALASYSIENRERHKDVPFAFTASNIRGVITLNVATFTLEAKGTYTLQWKLFWHNGWDDFFKKAKAEGFVKLDADRYLISQNESIKINIDGSPQYGIKQKTVILEGTKIGEQVYQFSYNGGKKQTMLNYSVISSPKNVINKRIHFIVDNQQMNDGGDPRNGAYMVYDNELKQILSKTSSSDRDEGRERIGMGVLIAKWLQRNNDEQVRISFMRYITFVREKLQGEDFRVFSNVAHTSRHRGYNYPWVAHLYLETYKLTNDKKYLSDFSNTLMKYFKEFGYQHYSIDFRVVDGLAALEKEGMKSEREQLLKAFTATGDFFVATGLNYPKHEVTYEQSIVAPAVTFLLEMYQVTSQNKYLEAAKIQLRSLEAFSGKQPDVHLYEIGIRHWDGFWFGKNPTWGDTMPHYWSTLTALAFQRYYQCTGEQLYEQRAKTIVTNNLLNFHEDGSASCAYLYPAYINEKKGKFYDPYANDQDWALVFYTEIMDK